MRAVIIGGAGFLGSHLVDLCLERKYEVVCLDKQGCDTSYMDSINVPVRDGDILDRDSIERHIERGDLVFCVAALLGVAKVNRQKYFEINVDGAVNALQAALNKKARAFVFPSSFATMGPVGSPENPMNEETPCAPDSLYGESKLEAEKRIHALGNGKIACLLFRAPPIFGPRSNPKAAASLLFENMRKKSALMIGDTRNFFPICYVKNLASAMLTLAEKKDGGVHTYLIADGPPVRFVDILTMMRREFGTNRRIVHFPFWLVNGIAWNCEMLGKLCGFTPKLSRDVVRAVAKSVYYYDISKALNDGYEPVATLAEGIHETVEWMKSREAT